MEIYNKEYFDAMERGANYRPKIWRLTREALKYKPKNALDVGCGHGFLVEMLNNKGVPTIGVDFSEYAGTETDKFIQADAKKLPFDDKEFDVVVSSDFFEHIPEEDIDQVYSEMKRVGKHVMAQISYKSERAHLTVKPREWWERKLPGCQIIKTYNERKHEKD